MPSAPDPRTIRVAIAADLLEERWPSMDLVADMLMSALRMQVADDMTIALLRPSLARPLLGRIHRAPSLERFLNRFWDYPRWVAARAADFDVIHVVDHSYAHLLHALPGVPSVVTCHDVDAFLPLVAPDRTPTRLPRFLSRRVLSGLQRASCVVCVSESTRREVSGLNLVPVERLSVLHNGVSTIFSPQPDPQADARFARLAGTRDEHPADILNVGTTIPRKRIDVLIRVVAALRDVRRDVRLLRAGGRFTAEQRDLAWQLGVDNAIVELPFLTTAELASAYRHARAVLVTSEREGFCLPIAEAMACGTPVVATDLPVLREVGGAAGIYRPLGDLAGWRDAVLLACVGRSHSPQPSPIEQACTQQAARFSWDANAAAMMRLYRRLAGTGDMRAAS